MIGKSKILACSVGKHWPIPYCSQHKAWMDQPTYQKWFDTVFLPEVQKHNGFPVLLLLDNAPGHFNGFKKMAFKLNSSHQTATVGSNHVTKE